MGRNKTYKSLMTLDNDEWYNYYIEIDNNPYKEG